ncbi:hypothetical protein EC973_004152 [Apophysomyces ossiformis]|uniref:Glutaredoxin domain-containing protein n=1 Tax=Apophysomyces ossiformis TaxID=679940 RepID=A0A8H7BH50_9FUNG|nr:hypothetical protein EC973_004152 [Apophysomyces ossiformis]
MTSLAPPVAKGLENKPVTARASRITATVAKQQRTVKKTATLPAPTKKKPVDKPVTKQPATVRLSSTENKARLQAKPTKAQLTTANTTNGVAPSMQQKGRRPPPPGHTPAAPALQLKKQLDQLTLKNEENLRRIAQQNLELKQLRSAVSSSDQQAKQTKKLSQIEDQLHQREKEVEKLKQQLKKKTAANTEKERALLEREVSLKKEVQTYKKQQSRMQDLESSARKNKELAKKLSEKEKELEILRNKAAEKLTNKSKRTIEDLTKQLETQRRNHEESLRAYKETLKRLEATISNHAEATEKLRKAHQEEIRQLQNRHSEKLVAAKVKYNEEIEQVRRQLEEALAREKALSKVNTDEQLEQILYEFEQASHQYPVDVPQDERDKKQVHSGLTPQVQSERRPKGWMARYLPTEAISWPAPQPLCILRKTEWLQPKDDSPKHARMEVGDDDNDDDDADSDDSGESFSTPDKVQLYVSNVCSNAITRKRQEHMKHLLVANHVTFEIVDVTSSTAVKSNQMKEIPHIFVGGEFRGYYNDVVRAVDDGTLLDLIKPATRRAKVLDPPTPTELSPATEDELLLQELEKEFKQGNITLADLDL